MHFHLTAIDREGKEWEVDSQHYYENWNVFRCSYRQRNPWLFRNFIIYRKGYPKDSDCILKELSSPSELEAWRKQCQK